MNKKLQLAIVLSLFLPITATYAMEANGKFTRECIAWYGKDDVPCYNIDYTSGSQNINIQLIVNGQVKGVSVIEPGITYTVADKQGGDDTVRVGKKDTVQFQFCDSVVNGKCLMGLNSQLFTFHGAQYTFTETTLGKQVTYTYRGGYNCSYNAITRQASCTESN